MEKKKEVEFVRVRSCQNELSKSSIDQSWSRCIQNAMISSDMPNASKVSSQRFSHMLEDNRDILKTAHPYIKMLSATATKCGVLIGLSNEEGVILYIEGNSPQLRELGYERGYIHQEAYMGTNAIGLCIEKGKSIIIRPEEHFLEILRNWVGFAAPIYSSDDKLIATIFSMIPSKTNYRVVIGAISVAAMSIERQLQLSKEKSMLLNIQEKMHQAQAGIIEASSIVSHDVRNALCNISAYIQLLQLEGSIDCYRGNRILKEIVWVNRLLDDFKKLTVRRLEKVSIQSLDKGLESLIHITEPKAELNNVRLIYKPCKRKSLIRADMNALHHVFINLIENAIQAMEAGGTLTIEVKIDPIAHEVLISFQDTGSGIPSDKIDQVFKMLYTTKRSGSGLGLHISRSIVNSHGGSIEVESVEGEGTVFIVRLPIIQ